MAQVVNAVMAASKFPESPTDLAHSQVALDSRMSTGVAIERESG